ATKVRTHTYGDSTLDPASLAVERVHATSLGARLLASRPVGGGVDAIGSLHVDSDQGYVDRDPDPIGGRSTIAEAATGVELRRGALSADAAAGVAVPLDTGADPWPEAKAAVKYRLWKMRLQPRLVAGYKGRLPELRERYDASIGNQAVGPEKVGFGEIGLLLDHSDWAEVDVSGFYRRTNGLIRLSPDNSMLVNIGRVTVKGIDARLTVFPYRRVRGGASVELLDAGSPQLGENPIDRMAERRGDVWVEGRWRRLRGLVRARYIGEMIDQGTTLPDYGLVDASSYLVINDELSASLRVDNLLDERYLDRASGVRGSGRSAMLSLQGIWE
ncbi:MAG TPA: TonB-dependent receptor, partial [Kofleriaceae bacterium]|nr:TonB-dependent receptor [Kofleriaceae bacterium]